MIVSPVLLKEDVSLHWPPCHSFFLFLTQGRGLSLSRFSWVGDKRMSIPLPLLPSSQALDFSVLLCFSCSWAHFLPHLTSWPAAGAPSCTVPSLLPSPHPPPPPQATPKAPPRRWGDSTFEEMPGFLSKQQMRKASHVVPQEPALPSEADISLRKNEATDKGKRH